MAASAAPSARLIVSTLLALGLAVLPSQAAPPDYAPPPGAVNPQVTQFNIAGTVCVRGWTRTVRPPAAYTGTLKRRQIAERRYPDTNAADYEEDHWIPLEIGGDPTSPRNLWPQPFADLGPAGKAKLKDKLELALRTAVCGGRMTLRDAQACLLNQPTWTACARRMHTPAW